MIDLLIFGFMVFGTLAGAGQHLLGFETVARDLTPTAFMAGDGPINSAAMFWGGDFVAAIFFSAVVMAVLYANVSVVREAFLVFEGVLFISLALTWSRKGTDVGNTQLRQVIAMDLALGSVGLLGAWITRKKRSHKKLE